MSAPPACPEAPLEIRAFLDGLVVTGDVSAVVALRGSARRIDWIACSGEGAPGKGVKADDRFDLSSLTKSVVATLAVVLDRQRRFTLDESIGAKFPDVPAALAARSWRDLLRHRAGFVPWLPLYRRVRRREAVFARLARPDLLGATAATYSDLGYIFWALAAERVLRRPILSLLQTELFRPLAIDGMRGPGGRRGIVTCRLDNAVEVALAAELGVRVGLRAGPWRGEAQDGNARFLGGVPGHAGLWGSAEDLWRLAREWLAPVAILDPSAVEGVIADRSRLALGWRRRRRSGSGGDALSRSSFGHPGFTGTSLWIDPEAGRVLVLLAHRTRSDVDMDRHRRRFHRLAGAV